jgi:hypothetical protein
VAARRIGGTDQLPADRPVKLAVWLFDVTVQTAVFLLVVPMSVPEAATV